MRIALAVAGLFLLTGCSSLIGGSSPKTHFYTLSAVVPAQGRSKAATSHPVTVAAVHLSATLDRTEMILGTARNAVDISNQNRWSGPLDEMSRRVLSEDLAALLPLNDVVMPDVPAPGDSGQIVVTLTEFGPQADGTITLSGEWALIDSQNGKPAVRHDVHETVTSPAHSGQAVAEAMSGLLGQLAGQMARALAQR